MIRKLSFRADPAAPYHTLEFHVRKANRIGILEPLHDENIRKNIIEETAASLCHLLNIPADFNIVFLRRTSLLNEAISKAFNDQKRSSEADTTPLEKGEDASVSMPSGLDIFDVPDHIPYKEYLVFFKDLDPKIGKKNIFPDQFLKSGSFSTLPIHGDMSYSVPSGVLEYSQFHSLVFRTHYGFGMDPGVSVWIARDPFYGKVMAHLEAQLESCTDTIGPERSRTVKASVDIDKLYILGKITSDLQNRGLQMIRNEIKYKSIVLYKALKDSHRFEPLIPDIKEQSENIICGRTTASKNELVDYFSTYGIEVDLYDDMLSNTIVRMANYPVHSREQVEYLSDLLTGF